MKELVLTTLLCVEISVPAQNGLIPPETNIIRTTWVVSQSWREISSIAKRTKLMKYWLNEKYPKAPHVRSRTGKSTFHHLVWSLGWKWVGSLWWKWLKESNEDQTAHISGHLWCHELEGANHGTFHLVHPAQLPSKSKIYQSVKETCWRKITVLLKSEITWLSDWGGR